MRKRKSHCFLILQQQPWDLASKIELDLRIHLASRIFQYDLWASSCEGLKWPLEFRPRCCIYYLFEKSSDDVAQLGCASKRSLCSKNRLSENGPRPKMNTESIGIVIGIPYDTFPRFGTTCWRNRPLRDWNPKAIAVGEKGIWVVSFLSGNRICTGGSWATYHINFHDVAASSSRRGRN